jgi:Divergent InlB B-repeat domain
MKMVSTSSAKPGAVEVFRALQPFGANTTSYVNSGLADNTAYCYRVNAFNSGGVSAYTSEVCGTTPAGTYVLTVSSQGNGTVTSNPAGINCGSNCIANFTSGTSVVLQAVAAQGYSFAGWSGDQDCNDGSVTMNTSKTCTATFNLIPQTFTLGVNLVKSFTAAGTANGTVTSSPAGISCGTDCSEVYTSGTSVTLTAAPAQGSNFIGWSGACTGMGTCTFTVTSNTSVTATFAELNVVRSAFSGPEPANGISM